MRIKCIFVYANSIGGVCLKLDKNDLIIGSYEPQKSGDYNNYAFLVYCEDNVPVLIDADKGVYIARKEENRAMDFNIRSLVPEGLFVRSYIPRKKNREASFFYNTEGDEMTYTGDTFETSRNYECSKGKQTETVSIP